ncbi:MAG: hypothetical protein NVS3B21_02870 [Acidimicrobiales bacterium]
MTLVHRVLSPSPITSLTEYLARGGGAGLEAALGMTGGELIAVVEASGLRGRGGAGFPTGRKWRTIAEFTETGGAPTVVVNGAEGEPGTFKDRTILRTNPFAVIEGAVIAARAVGAAKIVFGLKKSFTTEVAIVRSAVAEIQAAGWAAGTEIVVFEGPNEYLYGEETALLEVLDGRYPFPRIAPPWRRGAEEVVETIRDAASGSGQSAHVDMAGSDTGAQPTLVDNVETLANVARIIARGADWFRTEGTDESPGTIVCTITGDVVRAGVGEVIMGTPLREVIELIGGGLGEGRTIKAVLSGVSNPVLTGEHLDAPVSYEGLAAIGAGLGSAGFMVFDDTADLTAVAAGVSRFLAVESCGQCVPCKQDGREISRVLERICASDATEAELSAVGALTQTVADGARCFLATQHQAVVESILRQFPEDLARHVTGDAQPVAPTLIAELENIVDDTAVVDERHRDKQPDWTFDVHDSGAAPADRYGDHRHPLALPE